MANLNIPWKTTALAAVIGAVDGAASKTDAVALATDPKRGEFIHQRSTWVQGGSLALGLVMGMMRQNPDVVDAFILAPATLLARSGAFKMVESSKNVSTANPTGVQAFGRVRVAPYAPASSGPAHSAGYMKQPATGILG